MAWSVVIFANNGVHRGGFHQQVVFVAASGVFRLCDDCLGAVNEWRYAVGMELFYYISLG